jgi:nitrite reductase/ring-hydroxylating ferredoxin subunit
MAVATEGWQHNEFQRGYGTADSPTWRELADGDSKPIPATLREESAPNLGTARIPPERYTSHAYHRQEVEKLWKRTWQVVCREEEIPGVGDHFVYEVAGLSFLVARVAPDEFKAFWNVCLHRGRRLVDESGCAARGFRCGYHAWARDLNGNLRFSRRRASQVRSAAGPGRQMGRFRVHQSGPERDPARRPPRQAAGAFQVLAARKAIHPVARAEAGRTTRTCQRSNSASRAGRAIRRVARLVVTRRAACAFCTRCWSAFCDGPSQSHGLVPAHRRAPHRR